MVLGSAFCVSRLPRGRGVFSAVPGDCGIGDSPESRRPPCKGIKGVMSGDERGAVDTDGDTAGSMLGANIIVALRGPVKPDDALRADTSDEVRLRGFGLPLMSICVGALPR